MFSRIFKRKKNNTAGQVPIVVKNDSIEKLITNSDVYKMIDEYSQKRKIAMSEGKLEDFQGDLIVDDSTINQNIVSRMLRLLSIESEVASNGLDAIQKIANKNYRIVWMDIKMPILDGLVSSLCMREKMEYDGPICAVTAYGDMYTQQSCTEHGINYFMSKPITLGNIKIKRDKIECEKS
jgi:CheY-like chemotaxis protein